MRRKIHTEMLTCRVPKLILDILEELSEETYMPKAQIIREALYRYLSPWIRKRAPRK